MTTAPRRRAVAIARHCGALQFDLEAVEGLGHHDLAGEPGGVVGAGDLIEAGEFLVTGRRQHMPPGLGDTHVACGADAGAATFGLHRHALRPHQLDEMQSGDGVVVGPAAARQPHPEA